MRLTPQPGETMKHNARACLLATILVTVTFLVYKPAWNGEYIWDDDYYVTNNPLLTSADGLRRIWFSLDAPSQYFPLTYTTFRIERELWGLRPLGYHLVNIALHATGALLLWHLLARLRVSGAFFVAAIFALHPVQVESVAWITERKNVLMGVLFFLTVLAWDRSLTGTRRWRALWYTGALILYVLALSAKSTACTLPLALLSILWWKHGRIQWRDVKMIAPFFALALAAGLIAIWWERYHQGTHGDLFALGPAERMCIAARAFWFYIGKLVWPSKLTFIYPQWKTSARDPFGYAPLLVSIGACGVILMSRRILGRGVEAALFFFVATLAPVLGFIMLYTFRYTYVADHYQYLACIGPITLAVAGVAKLTEGKRLFPAQCLGGVILGVLAALTWMQAAIYRDAETLWRATIAENPGCWMAYNNLGIAFFEQQRFTEAVDQYQQSLRLRPQYSEAHYNLGNALLAQGDVSGAMAEDERAVQLAPNDPDARIAWGNAALTKGDVDLALSQYEQACCLRPGYADAHYGLGHALQQRGELDRGAAEYETAVRLNPELSDARINWAAILWGKKREDQAIAELERALISTPHSEKAQINLAWDLATASDISLRNGTRAVGLAEEAVRVFRDDPAALRVLAAAYAQDRQFGRAAATARAALNWVKDRDDDLAHSLRREVALYESGVAYRD